MVNANAISTKVFNKIGASLVNIGLAKVDDINEIIDNAIDYLLDLRDAGIPSKDAVIEPLLPLTDIGTTSAPSKFVDYVATNAYTSDSWVAQFSFTAPQTANTVTADLLAVRIKYDQMALAFGGLLLDKTTALQGLRAIHVYRLISKQQKRFTVWVDNAIAPQDYPYAYVPFPVVFLTKPGEELAIQVEFNQPWLSQQTASASSTAPVNINMKIELVPGVKLIPKASSSYLI